MHAIRLLAFAGMITVSLCMARGSAGHDGPHAAGTQPQWPTHIYLPTPIPDRICTSFTGDPATSFSVTWRTDTSVKNSKAEIALAEGGPGFTDKAQQIAGTSQTFKSNLGEAQYHQVDFEGLAPDTRYLYRVGSDKHWSEWIQFKTASDKSAPFTFVYFGDAQNQIKSHWSRVVRQAFTDASRAAFFLHAGDLVNSGASDAEWGEWYLANGFIPHSIPVIAAPGNHEMVNVPVPNENQDGEEESKPKTVRQVTPHWFATFAFPKNGPEKLHETCYYIDYQGARIVVLNSNQDQEVQATWLDDVLSAPGPRWKILAFHHPIYSSATGRDNKSLREKWQPIFDRHQVDVVLQGHDHTYARSNPIKYRPGTLEELNVPTGQQHQDEGGTVYAVSVSGPKMYKLEPQPSMANWATQTQLYQVIRIEGDVLTYRAMTATGDLYDEFILQKRDGKPNELVKSIQRARE